MPVVTNTVKRPDGTAYTSGRVVIELAGENGRPLSGGYVTAGDYTIESAFTIETLTAGAWSQSLVANSLINPAGTAWRITEQVDGRNHVYYVTVPETVGPHFVEDILTDAPATVTDAALTAHIADTSAHNSVAFPYVFPLVVSGAQTLGTTLVGGGSSVIGSGWLAMDADTLEAPTGWTMQWRIVAAVQSATAGDEVGIALYDYAAGPAAFVITEVTGIAPDTSSWVLASEWAAAPTTRRISAVFQARNQTAARGVIRQASVEFQAVRLP